MASAPSDVGSGTLGGVDEAAEIGAACEGVGGAEDEGPTTWHALIASILVKIIILLIVSGKKADCVFIASPSSCQIYPQWHVLIHPLSVFRASNSDAPRVRPPRVIGPTHKHVCKYLPRGELVALTPNATFC